MAFSTWYMRKPFTLDLVWATACLAGPAFLMFRGGLGDVAR